MAGMPTGTVTLLFTDIEGSTRRWEALPAAMAAALAQHDDLLRWAIEANGGHVFKTVGDAFCAAFADPGDALRACLVAQRSLAATDWGAVGHVRVRMALHTGEPEHRERDYFGPPVNRVARLLSTGFGAQVLVSAATAEQLSSRLPAEVTLRDLGAHRLKDLLQPERVYQVTAPGLEAEFPPIKSLDRQPHNLPAQPTPLVGREAEVAAARALLEDGARLVTLTGPGGTGKTRLGLQVAAELLDGFPDGAWFAGLAPLADAALVADAIAQPLGVREAGHEPLEATLLDYLRHKRLLLVLDNFEHVLAAAPLVGRLLGECKGVQILATSRAALRVYGEREVAVPPLRLPDPKRLPPLEELVEVEAVALFVERAQAVKPGFGLTAEIARPVAELVVKLEGLPLAIELAAARVRVLPPAQLLSRLTSRLALLTGGAADRDERQRTLRGAIAWSHDLLAPPEQALFRRLSVFAGGCTFEAVEAVCTADGAAGDALDGLESLVQKSLLRQEEGPGGDPRFGMLETIREFGLEQLEAHAEASSVRAGHASFFLAFAETAEPQLSEADQALWLDRLDTEHDNLRAALAWLSDVPEAEPAQRLAGLLGRFWYLRGHLSEGRSWLERALAQAEDVPGAARAWAMAMSGRLAWAQGDFAPARAMLERALDMNRQLGYGRGIANTLGYLGLVAHDQGEFKLAQTHFEGSLAEYRRLDDQPGVADALSWLGMLAFSVGDYDRAATYHEEHLAVSQQFQDRQMTAYVRFNLAETRHHQGALDSAKTLYDEVLAVFRELGDKDATAHALWALGRLALQQGDAPGAGLLLREGLFLAEEVGDKGLLASCLEGFAGSVCAAGDGARAARLLGATEALREAIGAPLQPAYRADHDAYAATALELLGLPTFAAAWEAGRSLPLERAIAEATGSE